MKFFTTMQSLSVSINESNYQLSSDTVYDITNKSDQEVLTSVNWNNTDDYGYNDTKLLQNESFLINDTKLSLEDENILDVNLNDSINEINDTENYNLDQNYETSGVNYENPDDFFELKTIINNNANDINDKSLYLTTEKMIITTPRKDISYEVKMVDDSKVKFTFQINLNEEEYNSLLEWYNIQIENTGRFCREFKSDVSLGQKFLQKCLQDYPKCVTKSIRQVCECEESCLKKFTNDLKIEKCDFFDPATNFYNFYENEYVYCCWPSKFPNDKLKYIGNSENLEKVTNKFHESVIKLCLDTKNYNEAKCSLLELQDEYYFDEEFRKRNLVLLNFDQCANEFFNEDIKKLKNTIQSKIFDIKLYSKYISKREIGDINKTISINDNKQLEKGSTLNNLMVACLICASMASGFFLSILVDRISRRKIREIKQLGFILSILVVISIYLIYKFNTYHLENN